MIRFVDETLLPELTDFVIQDNIYACRIACLLESYGTGYPFLSFYLQKDKNDRTVSAISEYYSDITAILTYNSDIEELESFLLARGFSSLLCGKQLLTGYPCEEGIVMQLYDKEKLLFAKSNNTLSLNTEPDLSEIWRLLKTCEDGSFHVPEYEDFLLDMSHKIRHGTALCLAAEHEGLYIGSAMTVAQSSCCAVIGAVCTARKSRRNGTGSFCVKELCKRLPDKSIFVMRSKEKNEEFYRSLGFENRESFYIITGKRKEQ